MVAMNRKEEIESIQREKASVKNETLTKSNYKSETSRFLIDTADLIEELAVIKAFEDIGVHLPIKGDDCVEFRKD